MGEQRLKLRTYREHALGVTRLTAAAKNGLARIERRLMRASREIASGYRLHALDAK